MRCVDAMAQWDAHDWWALCTCFASKPSSTQAIMPAICANLMGFNAMAQCDAAAYCVVYVLQFISRCVLCSWLASHFLTETLWRPLMPMQSVSMRWHHAMCRCDVSMRCVDAMCRCDVVYLLVGFMLMVAGLYALTLRASHLLARQLCQPFVPVWWPLMLLVNASMLLVNAMHQYIPVYVSVGFIPMIGGLYAQTIF